jgi:HD-GYP domain-containing protein (c-di-GMP phosphodiesterase class II)
MLETLIDIAAYKSVDAIVSASGWSELQENSFPYVRRYLKHGQRDGAMYTLALPYHPEVIPFGVTQTQMRVGAMCHDIGKPWVTDQDVDSTLWDRNGLSDEDKDTIRLHPSVSYWLLRKVQARGIAVPRVALDIAIAHHERLDRSGYPHGLMGDQIPSFVQLFSVVDYVVSLAEGPKDRRYRTRGWSIQEIESFLRHEMKNKLNQEYVTTVLGFLRRGEHLNVPELEDLDSIRIL